MQREYFQLNPHKIEAKEVHNPRKYQTTCWEKHKISPKKQQRYLRRAMKRNTGERPLKSMLVLDTGKPMKMVKEQCGTVKLNPTIVRKGGQLVRNPSNTVTHPRAFELSCTDDFICCSFLALKSSNFFPK